jgi:type IV secretion system protein VirB1
MIPNLDVIQQYAPNVAPQTIAAIIRVESGGNPFAVGINGRARRRIRPKSAQEAASEARYFIAKGYSVDLGLMQINSRNLRRLGLTVEQAFDPGANIQAGAKILTLGYCGAIRRYGPGQDALRAALSAYNTGNYERGFKNGYVAKYFPTAGVRCGITSIVVTAPPAGNAFMIPPRIRVFGKETIVNPYIADLTVYNGSEQ